MGYAAAEKLHALMSGEDAEKTTILPPRELVVRGSTLSVSYPSEALRASIRFLWENFRNNVTVTDVAKAGGIGAKQLGTLMKRYMHTSVHQELLRLRLDYAKEKLLNTDDKIERIGLACGFNSDTAFHIAFKRWYGTPPGQFRKRREGSDG